MLRIWSSFLFLSLVCAAGLTAAQVQVHSSNQDNLVLSIHLNSDQQAPVTASGASQPLSLIDLPRGEDKFLPAAIISFVVPPGTTPVLASQSLTYAGKSLLSEQYDKSLAPNQAQIELVPSVSIRGLQVAKLIVPRVVSDAQGIRTVERADVAIDFRGTAQPGRPLRGNSFQRMLSQVVVNWGQAVKWGAAANAKLAADEYDPISYSGNWAQISITTSGVYSLSRTDLSTSGIDVVSIDPATVRIFTLGGKTLPIEGSAPRDSLSEMAVLVEDDDGVLAGDDQILFYANGPDFWEYDDGLKFRHNPYNNVNIYYLTWGGDFPWAPRRILQFEAIGPAAQDTLTEFVDHIHLEENNSLGSVGGEIDDYFTWYWKLDQEFTLNFNLPQSVVGAANSLILNVAGTVDLARLNFAESLVEDSIRRPLFYYTTENLQAGLNQLEMTVSSWRGDSFTDYLEILYRRPLIKSDNEALNIYAPAESVNDDLLAYRVAVETGTFYLLDITTPQYQALSSYTISDGELSFSSYASALSGRIFCLATPGDLLKPAQIVTTQIDDLRSPANAADLILLTHQNFYSQALDFAGYRQSHNGLRTRVVKINDVYAQFSGGLVDPVAIRDFLGYTYRNWSGGAPSYCLLVGDGVYDFRDYLGTGAVNYIPPFIVVDDETVSDENYAYFDQIADLDYDDSFDTTATPLDRGVDMVIARWPVSSASEFLVIAEKMQDYESGINFGSWRNQITLIADDENHGTSLPERQHTEDSELLADNYIPPQFDLNKIYSVDYPFGTGGQKPEVREAIIRSINSGTLIVNYVGHGNPNVWADERIFRRTEDIPRLANRNQLPLIFNASCSIGFFDDPLLEGMAEDFLSYAAGGAIGTVSATRLVYSRPNAEFNKTAFYFLLGDFDFTVAEATYVAKLVRQELGQETNDRKYIYIGDPLTKLGFAPLSIEFGALAPDSLVALTVTEVEGVIVNKSGVPQNSFAGTIEISVFDSERERAFQFPPFTDSVTYTEYGPAIYRGKVAVENGNFSLKFVVPKDITYGGRSARLSGYASDGVTGAAGFVAPIAIGGINTEVIDTIGPEIEVYFNGDQSQVDGTRLEQKARVTIAMFDSLGINLSGEIGHTIDLIIDDDPSYAYVLNDSFSYNPGSYQQGETGMILPELTPGEHTLKAKAWDSANNSSQIELGFSVGEAQELQISDLLCYPNPVAEACEFSYSLSRAASDVTLKVFTVSGLEIYEQRGLPGQSGFNGGIVWSGRDLDGDQLANGVYIFQLSALALDGSSDDKRVTVSEKLIVMK